MNSLIKETNEKLKAIIDELKEKIEVLVSALDYIQGQMDKKVEDAKDHKSKVDSAKQIIKDLEAHNLSLETSLEELNDKYGKLNLISVIEAGNKEINAKINDNLKEINNQKEKIAQLTMNARTIKNLLLQLKNDKIVKQEKLSELESIYEFYSFKINNIVDYSINHSENLANYKEDYINEVDRDSYSNDIDNLTIFEEIANIEEDDSIIEETYSEEVSDESFDISGENFDSLNDKFIIDSDKKDDLEDYTESSTGDEFSDEIDIVDESITAKEIENAIEFNDENDFIDSYTYNEVDREDNISQDFINFNSESIIDENIFEGINKVEEIDNEDEDSEESAGDKLEISPIDEQFVTNNNENTESDNMFNIDFLNTKIDTAFKETFDKPINEEFKSDSTLLDIFGNPIANNEVSEEVVNRKKIEELFVLNGIDFNKFKEDEQNYLKDIYDEEKFKNVFEILKRNNINVDNIYNAFNIFGEISSNELESIISKLIFNGQSVEAVGLILEKLPKVKKYNLDEAIISYGDYIKDVDIVDLIMKAKELSEAGGNI